MALLIVLIAVLDLPTFGKATGEQATLILDHYRKQVVSKYRIYRNPKLEQLSELMLAADSSNINDFLPQVNGPDWRSMVALTIFTDADAGSIIQILLDDPNNRLPDEEVAIPDSMVRYFFRHITLANELSKERPRNWIRLLCNRKNLATRGGKQNP